MAIIGALSSSELIDAVKRRAFLPNTQNALDDQDILNFLNEELNDSVIPLIMSMHEEYFLTKTTIPLVANQQNYKIPYRAVGRKIRDVKFADPNGNLYRMPRVDPSQRDYFQHGEVFQPIAFHLQGDEIVVINKIGQSVNGSLEIMYYLKPNELVKENRVATVTSIDLTNGILTLSSIPSNLTVGSSVDLLEAKFGNRTLGFDKTITAIDNTNKTVTLGSGNVPSTMVVGDFIASAGECIIPQIPVEMHSILAERAAARCLASLGDVNGVQVANGKIAEMENKVGAMIDNRTEGQPQKVNNLQGLLRRSRVARRRFFK